MPYVEWMDGLVSCGDCGQQGWNKRAEHGGEAWDEDWESGHGPEAAFVKLRHNCGKAAHDDWAQFLPPAT